MKEEVESIRKEVEWMQYRPPPYFRNAYEFFWKLRRKSPHEYPIDDGKILNFQNLYNIHLDIWEIETIFELDRTYYKASKELK